MILFAPSDLSRLAHEALLDILVVAHSAADAPDIERDLAPHHRVRVAMSAPEAMAEIRRRPPSVLVACAGSHPMSAQDSLIGCSVGHPAILRVLHTTAHRTAWSPAIQRGWAQAVLPTNLNAAFALLPPRCTGRLAATLLVDDGTPTRPEVVSMLAERPNARLVRSLDEATSAIRELVPQIVLCAFRRDGDLALQVLRLVAERHPATKRVLIADAPLDNWNHLVRDGSVGAVIHDLGGFEELLARGRAAGLHRPAPRRRVPA